MLKKTSLRVDGLGRQLLSSSWLREARGKACQWCGFIEPGEEGEDALLTDLRNCFWPNHSFSAAALSCCLPSRADTGRTECMKGALTLRMGGTLGLALNLERKTKKRH